MITWTRTKSKFKIIKIKLIIFSKSNLRKVPRPEDDMPPPPIEKPPSDSEEDDQYIQPYQQTIQQQQQQPTMASNNRQREYNEYHEPPKNNQPRPVQDQARGDRISDPAKLPFSQRVNLFKQSQQDPSRQEYKNYIK